jgi:GTP cyclohydrolase II
MFNKTEKIILKIEKSILELKLGIPIIIKDKDSSILFASTENMDPKSFQRFINYNSSHLLLSKNRARYLFKNVKTNILIDCNNLTFNQITSLTYSNPKQIKLKADINPADTIHQHIIKLLQLAELIPSAIVTKIDKKLKAVSEINLEDMLIYADQTNKKYKIVVEAAPLNLKHLNAKMYAFMSSFGNKDHYAIVIGDALKSSIPIVRVHSSCFTGDLLNSINCDCYDQLHQSLKTMNDNPQGGILIYLNQEGRGIGLTNKLRAYALQEEGYDTVEANEILGFSDDQRFFYPAAAILKLLNIKQIRLLTNNPKKANGLEELGIKVVEKLPIIACKNDRVKKYYEIKEKKLGHKFN